GPPSDERPDEGAEDPQGGADPRARHRLEAADADERRAARPGGQRRPGPPDDARHAAPDDGRDAAGADRADGPARRGPDPHDVADGSAAARVRRSGPDARRGSVAADVPSADGFAAFVRPERRARGPR